MRLKYRFTLLLFLSFFQVSFGQEEAIEKYQGLDLLMRGNSFFENHLTGFFLFDLDKEWVLYEKNSHINFIPASTTKLLTFYASLVTLKDSVNTFRYVNRGDEITVWGTGDPSWMYEPLPQPKIKQFLDRYKKVNFSIENWKDEAFGVGWQWDDYYHAYSAERSPFPIYGNLASISSQNRQPFIYPSYFRNTLRTTDKDINGIRRDLHSNLFYHNPRTYNIQKTKVPFITSPDLFVTLAGEILDKPVQLVNTKLPTDHKIYRGGKIEPLWKEMLQESDNFIAEQLLLMISDELFGEMNTERAIDYVLKNHLENLPDKPQWVDGSGLSRYNLVTPRSMVEVLVRIDRLLPRSQLLGLLPQGGVNGTLKNNFKSPQPYIFAKTGTISNNNSLVGIIKTDQDNYLAFAFMNNNYLNKASAVRREMEKVLLYIKEYY
jgi:serine-type D-Ala-D-Ala carboxypeptidase/endopeptidase (penicillin-binding protein 4)